ncbi:WD repeat and FYVE domain-containing protein 3 [Trichoplax sp. H2]|nr:WD repeat and FYVE domain-containing protein 3 [Trichoplax sp. H2]|eukprot:RDD46997.1 WD repeat and FYVE domain-containing protein 3 [Trichoplax sp. H2]
MHLVRKLVGRVRSNSDLENQRSRSGSDPSTDDSNSLMNLRKLYVDYCQVPDPSDSGRSLQELKLYKMLPLFCQLFGNAQPSDMFERFGDILPFTKHVSRLFVSEIRRRVSNHASEEASSAIIEYLETTDQSVRSGWNLLKTIQLLSAGNSAIVASLVATSLPSTMVKCMYLFYDLPSPCKSDELTSNRPIETTPSTTTLSTQQQQRRQLQIMYGKILSRLCQFIGPIEELVRKDDLALLMSAVTTWCPNYNKPWRNIASSCIRTISSSKLSTMVLDYIHSKSFHHSII